MMWRRGLRRFSSEKVFLLEYKYVPDILEKRGPYRSEHIGRAEQHPQLVMFGAKDDPPTGALAIFRKISSLSISQLNRRSFRGFHSRVRESR